MSLADRRALLELAAAEDLLLLEDNPYGLFGHDRAAAGADPEGAGSSTGRWSTSARSPRPRCPASGSATWSPISWCGDARPATPSLLADELSKLKSMLTVNTSPITQAIVGGKLLENGGSLLRGQRARAGRLHPQHAADGARAGEPGSRIRARRCSWNAPVGGFFVVVTVPFPVDDALLERSAADYGVLWTPMHHFYEAGVAVNSLRLSCSSVTLRADRGRPGPVGPADLDELGRR